MRAFNSRIDAIEKLRSAPICETTAKDLRKLLADRSNYLVSEAAAITADLRLSELAPDLMVSRTVPFRSREIRSTQPDYRLDSR